MKTYVWVCGGCFVTQFSLTLPSTRKHRHDLHIVVVQLRLGHLGVVVPVEDSLNETQS